MLILKEKDDNNIFDIFDLYSCSNDNCCYFNFVKIILELFV